MSLMSRSSARDQEAVKRWRKGDKVAVSQIHQACHFFSCCKETCDAKRTRTPLTPSLTLALLIPPCLSPTLTGERPGRMKRVIQLTSLQKREKTDGDSSHHAFELEKRGTCVFFPLKIAGFSSNSLDFARSFAFSSRIFNLRLRPQMMLMRKAG